MSIRPERTFHMRDVKSVSMKQVQIRGQVPVVRDDAYGPGSVSGTREIFCTQLRDGPSACVTSVRSSDRVD